MADTERPKKLQRISQACDLCHRRSIRCRPSAEYPQHKCQNCYDFAIDCTYNRPSRRRKNPPIAQTTPPNVVPNIGTSQQPKQFVSPSSDGSSSRQHSLQDTISGARNGTETAQNAPTGAYGALREGRQEDGISLAWHSFALASGENIQHLTDLYMDVVYPIYPLFHGPTLRERVRKRQYLDDAGFFASIMAACALVAARVRDGALGERCSFHNNPEKASELFFAAAQATLPKDLNRAHGVDWMRACGLMALTSIQYGQINTLHQYLGIYHTLSAMQQFHHETQWPRNLSVVDKEERRRLFWAMYGLDVYTAVVFDATIKSQETHSYVRYPSEVNDEDLTAGIATPRDDSNWLRGWNFTTDLYRTLEHSTKRLRRNRESHDDRVSITRLVVADAISEAQVMENVLSLYYQIPSRFQVSTVRHTGDKNNDYYGFQAANIQATLQLVRMTLFSSGTVTDVHQRCDAAEQALDSFRAIAPEFLRAINTPLIYHLGGIGRILASVMEGLLSEDLYLRVRGLLVSMADLLQALESSLHPTDGASQELRNQVEKIDQYMNSQRQIISSMGQQHQHRPAQPQLLPPQQNMPIANILGVESVSQLQPQVSIPNAVSMHAPIDEFQLPGYLVNDAVWPWPFEFSEQLMPMRMGYS